MLKASPALVLALFLFVPLQIDAGVISVKLGSNLSNPGAAAAGVIPAPKWNNLPIGATGASVRDSSEVAVPKLSVSNTVTFGAIAVGNSDSSFDSAPNQRVMASLAYVGVGGQQPGMRLEFSGTLPYEYSDIYIYVHSGLIGSYKQDVMIMSSNGGDLGLSKVAVDIDGKATNYIETGDGTTSGNYVVFRHVPTTLLGSGFIIQTGGGRNSGEYGFMNGLQIVESTPPPPNAPLKSDVESQ